MSSANAQPVDTPSNHGPIVGVVTWFLLAATVCAVIARILTKLAISRRFTCDDFLIFAALVREWRPPFLTTSAEEPQGLSIGQGVTVTQQIANGLGKHAETLSAFQLAKFYKVSSFPYAQSSFYA